MLILEDLDFKRWTPVKVTAVKHALGVRYNTARDALRELVRLNYLEQGEPDDNGVNTYRLLWACPLDSQTAPPQAS